MKTVEKIIALHGGMAVLRRSAISIKRPPSSGLMRLCIEDIGPGPRGGRLISVAHYFEQNGDLCRDPDMVFEYIEGQPWGPVTFQQDIPPLYQEAVWKDEQGKTLIRPRLVVQLKSFARTWDRNLKEQGFIEAYTAQKAAKPRTVPAFNEAECGGAFDGREVSSDADSGL